MTTPEQGIRKRKQQVKRYLRSIKGVVQRIWSMQPKNSKIRGHNPPTYTLKELRTWILSQSKFYNLYNSWVNSGYKRSLKPSIDRIDCNEGYSFDNIQLMTFGENEAKAHKEHCQTKGNRRIAVYAKDDAGKIILSYSSYTEAGKSLGVEKNHIWQSVHHHHRSCGYYWFVNHEADIINNLKRGEK